MKFIDLFAGIGGFRLGMEMAGHECVGYVEIDKFARQSYEAIHDTKGEWTANDIRAVDPWELPEADCYTAGFPCQSFSIAGKRGGFKDTRGTLFFEIMRLAEARKPKYLFLENVRGLLSHDGGKTFGTILSSLWELGYDAEWQVLNSKDHGVPQNRERVFIIGHLGEGSRRKVFPIRKNSTKTSLRFVGGIKTGKMWLDNGKELSKCFPQGNRIYSADGIASTLASKAKTELYMVQQMYDKEKNPQSGRVYSMDGVSPCLAPSSPKGTAEMPKIIRIGNLYPSGGQNGDVYDSQGLSPTLRSGGRGIGSCNAPKVCDHNHDGLRIRKLTPLECWRLQGFPDWTFHKARDAGISDSQLYRQAGNAVTVNVVYEIARRFKEAN